MNKAVQSVKSALPTGGKAKTKSRGRSSSSGMPKGKGLAGLAALAGAAGVALSQRDKISSLVNRGNQDDEGRATPQAGTVPPSATPPVDQPFGAPAPERGTGI